MDFYKRMMLCLTTEKSMVSLKFGIHITVGNPLILVIRSKQNDYPKEKNSGYNGFGGPVRKPPNEAEIKRF